MGEVIRPRRWCVQVLCADSPIPGMPCRLPAGHDGVHFLGDLDIDAVYRKEPSTPALPAPPEGHGDG